MQHIIEQWHSLIPELKEIDDMKCALCEEQFTDDDLEEMRVMGEIFHRENNYFICPDCYDDYRRMCLEDQISTFMKSAL